MSSYLKISLYNCRSNQALLKCIMYIGRYYGKNNIYDYNEGLSYLAKKIPGASKRSINFMVYSLKVDKNVVYKNDYESKREWRFKKISYIDTFEYIINRLLNKKKGNYEEAIELLHTLYIENITCLSENTFNSNVISNILVRNHRLALRFATGNKLYDQDCIKKIVDNLNSNDEKYGPF